MPVDETARVNFLAHLVLAPQTPRGLVGSIAPDLIRGPLPADLDPEIAEAAAEHQRIDRFTDSHQAFHQTRRRLAEVIQPRFAGVLADVFYDHLLAHGWADWRPDSLGQFVDHCEQTLTDNIKQMPESMRPVVRMMIKEHWLSSYATAQGLHARLTSMSARLTGRFGREVALCPTIDQIEALRADSADDFGTFWPQLLSFVDGQRQLRIGRRAS